MVSNLNCESDNYWRVHEFLLARIERSTLFYSFIYLLSPLYSAILRSGLEQTHCARMWFYTRFWISTEVVYLQRWHGWCHVKLLPSRRVLCTPYNYAPCHFMQRPFLQSDGSRWSTVKPVKNESIVLTRLRVSVCWMPPRVCGKMLTWQLCFS